MKDNGQKLPEVSIASLIARKPAWAEALIVAELEQDTSEIQSDYFGSRTVRTVAIGWRKGKKDDFKQYRAAAGRFAPTAHLGPGCDIWTARVVLLDDVRDNGSAYWAGHWSPWHRELQQRDGEPHGNFPTFTTEAEARAFVASKGEPHAMQFGEREVTAIPAVTRFAWEIKSASIEHREKWSMGHGYYLAGGGGRYSGWQVRGIGSCHPDCCSGQTMNRGSRR